VAEVLTEQALHQKSSQELTSILYEACIGKLERASTAIKEKNYEEANKLLQTCNDILYRLGAGLNYEAGIIADQLEAIYTYMAERLIEANVKKSVALIHEVIGLLRIISEAWNVALEKGMDTQGTALRKKALVYEQDFFYDHGTVDRKE
jgi:flagellar secretion chaperone FliS